MTKFDFNRSAYLLGAGASCDAGLPAIGKLKELIQQAIKAKNLENAIFSFVEKEIENHKIGFKQYGGAYGDTDIEDIISGIRAIGKLSREPVTPFLKGEYGELWELIVANHGFNKQYYEQFKTDQDKIRFLEGAVSRVFENISRLLISELRVSSAAKLQYLAPLLDKGANNKLDIFTLNYDDSIEYLIDTNEEYKALFHHGFGELLSHPLSNIPTINCLVYQNIWGAASPCINLYKLHGSIDWLFVQVDSEVIRIRDKDFPPNSAEEHLRISFRKGDYSPAVVFGKTDKLRSEGIYLDLLMKFHEVLREKDNLCVVGYSFRDPHINRFISRWMIDNENAVLCIITPDIKGALHNMSTGAFGIRAHNPNKQRMFLIESTFADLTASEQFKHGVVDLKEKLRWMSLSDIVKVP